MRVGLSEKITNHTLKNILLYPLVWQDVLIFCASYKQIVQLL